jgi:hypothetical protein
MSIGTQMKRFAPYGLATFALATAIVVSTTAIDAEARKGRSKRIRTSVESVELDSRVRGTLRSGGSERYELVLESRTTIAIRMEKTSGSSVDPIVKLLSDDDTEIAQNDDGGEGLNSYLLTTLRAGRYIIVTGAVGESSGGFELTVEELDEFPTISVGDRERGRLDSGERGMYQLQLDHATEVSINVTTISETNLDPRVAILDDDGSEVASDDDGGEGKNAALIVSLPAGSYTVVVSAFGTTEGRYRLDVGRPDTHDEGSIDVGDSRRGSVSEANERHSYTLSVRRSAEVRIDLRKTSGSELDPKMSLRTEDGDEIELDDDSGGDLNSRIERQLSEGDYLIVVIGHNGSTGDYTLSVDREGENVRQFQREGEQSGGSRGKRLK